MSHDPSTNGATLEARIDLSLENFRLNLDVKLPSRGLTALYGPSGAGKSTLLRCMAGLEPTMHGRISVDGQLWHDTQRQVFIPAHRRDIGMVFQDSRLFDHLRVLGNIEFGMKRVPIRDRRFQLDEVIELLGISHLLERRPGRLSGGEKQRVAMARALLTSPKLLLLDEPLAALDARLRMELLPYIERLRDEAQMPILYVSHSLEEVTRLADALVLIEHGQLLALGSIGEMTSRIDLPLAQADDAATVVSATVIEHDSQFSLTLLDIGGASIWVPQFNISPNRAVRVKIAARDISIALESSHSTSILNVLPAIITLRADDDSGRTLLQMQVGDVRLLARVTKRSAVALGLHEGQQVFAQLKAVAILG